MVKGTICFHGAMLGLVLLFCFSLLVLGKTTDPREVSALKAVRRKLKDPMKNLRNWTNTDPCEPTNGWNGVVCTEGHGDDPYLHVQQLRLMNMNLSGELSPQLGQFSQLLLLDFMWNYISGSIPKEIGNLSNLWILVLNGNQLSGPLPDELGNLRNLLMFQVDQNQISGPIPKSLANMTNVMHFHMNNNSFSGQIPSELSQLKNILHILLDNNNLSGSLPPELSNITTLRILQLDNNNFSGTEIPNSYATMPDLVKLTLRNCNLQGNVPDFSSVPGLLYLDLSSNNLNGSIPTNKFPFNITTIDLSGNMLIGSIPSNLSGLPRLQKLSLENNRLTGNVPSTIWENMTFSAVDRLNLNFENNFLSNISGSFDPPSNVSVRLQGNPVCSNAKELNIAQFCGLEDGDVAEPPGNSNNNSDECKPQSCLTEGYEYVPDSPVPCFCAAPIGLWYRLRSPSMSHFEPYIGQFKTYVTSNLGMDHYQLDVGNFTWHVGPKLILFLKIFPPYRNTSNKFSGDEIKFVTTKFYIMNMTLDNLFGPFDPINFTLIGPYENVIIKFPGSGMSKGLLAGIILGAISCGATLIMAIMFIFNKTHPRDQRKASKYKTIAKKSIKFEGVKGFNFSELETATDNFSITTQVGQGGYGKVYKGILADSTIVAIKRAHQGSLQGENEFYTEIEILSRLHHRNLVSLVGYCDEEGEQMLVYEFMPNGSLHTLLSEKFRSSLGFAMRLHIALDAARGILYLHTEADPPIIHRDIKANNILLDSKFTAKVSDFGISKLAPVTDAKGFKMDQISTVVKGTPGYLDPEYFYNNMLTEKSDVYSLGIVFLELLTGMPPISHGKNIVREVFGACQSGKMFSIVDRNMGPYKPECLKKFMDLAVKCSHDETSARPSMLEVVRELEDITSMLPESASIQSLPSLQSEMEYSSSGASGSEPTPLNSQRNTYISPHYHTGSDLVSGVIPTISPR